MSRVTAVIPARYDSHRFPGKVLADRTGKPLIQHVYERVRQADCIDHIIIATDDARIVSAVEAFGGTAQFTRPEHANGTSRIAEVAQSLSDEIIVNIQGDEPEIEPTLIDLAVQTLRDHPDCPMGTVASPFADDEDPANPNIVKVAMDVHGRALFFTRSLVPHQRDEHGPSPMWLKHVGMYVYRRPFLAQYVALPSTPLEQAEQLEQLRVLEHGFHIAVALGRTSAHGIDTPEQYEAFVHRING
jgi:3-deoxy-manno-octulosonate cytidylyltransferase (CMP-KDO synthetase)